MRLYQTVGGGTTVRMAYDGLDRIAEYDGSDIIQRRYVHGPAIDQPLVWYEGTGTSDRRFLSGDERGSIVSVTDGTGALLRINKYDEYGNPEAGNLGTFGYTGQAWLPGINAWYYKARIYDPELGRFLQPDPIGYVGGINLYGYVGNDPVNAVDPIGFGECPPGQQWGTPTGSHIQGCMDPGAYGGTLGIGYAPASGSYWSRMLGPVGGSFAAGGYYRWESGPPTHQDSDTIVVTAGHWVWQSNPIGGSPIPPQGFPRSFIAPAPRVLRNPPAFNPARNYCGGEGGTALPSGTWNRACYNHDICYGTAGASRGQCDSQFAREIARSCPIAPIGTCGTVPVSWIGWLLVRLGGRQYFNPTLWTSP